MCLQAESGERLFANATVFFSKKVEITSNVGSAWGKTKSKGRVKTRPLQKEEEEENIPRYYRQSYAEIVF